MVKVECIQCGREFSVKNSRHSKVKFCGYGCRDVYKTLRNRKLVECAICGVYFSAIKSRTHVKYCSVPCMAKGHHLGLH